MTNPSPSTAATKKDHTIKDAADTPIDRERLSDAQDRPLTTEEALEESLEDSMDGSDPASPTQPGDNGEPVPSSGFREGE